MRRFFVSCVLLAMLGCKKEGTEDARGPLEKAGAWVDNAAQKTGKGLEKAADATGRGLSKAGQEVEEVFAKGDAGVDGGR